MAEITLKKAVEKIADKTVDIVAKINEHSQQIESQKLKKTMLVIFTDGSSTEIKVG